MTGNNSQKSVLFLLINSSGIICFIYESGEPSHRGPERRIYCSVKLEIKAPASTSFNKKTILKSTQIKPTCLLYFNLGGEFI